MQKLAINGGERVIDPQKARFIWPKVTPAVERVLITQLHEGISIYNRSGIFEEFENKFANYHNVPHSLLSNSGTSAIFSMFEGINLQPEDEIICPTYTFHATISSVVYTGAIPVFCDCQEDGNIDPQEIKRKITKHTKAIIITHMWGIPCDMYEIVNLCKNYNLLLLEDCSHAHGASYDGKKVGSFGDAAAWSLQGQKIITGGEGGIMLTQNEDIFVRATLQGHYNKRCSQEIPKNHSLYQYALTGFGLKLRAHPLAIAIANQQFDQLDDWIKQKHIFAEKIIQTLKEYPFLSMPEYLNRQPSWYAFVMQFVPKKANGVTIGEFERALHAEGLVEVDRPGSTSPLHDLPLFTRPDLAMKRLYKNPIHQSGKFENAVAFYQNAIKIPVWAFDDDTPIMQAYIRGFCKVCDVVMQNPTLLKS